MNKLIGRTSFKNVLLFSKSSSAHSFLNGVKYLSTSTSDKNNNNSNNDENNIDYDDEAKWSNILPDSKSKKIKKCVLTGQDRTTTKKKDLSFLNQHGLLVKLKTSTHSKPTPTMSHDNNDDIDGDRIVVVDEYLTWEPKSTKKSKKLKNQQTEPSINESTKDTTKDTTIDIDMVEQSTLVKKRKSKKQKEESTLSIDNDLISVELDPNETTKSYNLDENGDNIVEMSPGFKDNKISSNKPTKTKSKKKQTVKLEQQEEKEEEKETDNFKTIDIDKLKKKKKQGEEEDEQDEYLNIKNVYKEWNENIGGVTTTLKSNIKIKNESIKITQLSNENKQQFNEKREWDELVESCNRQVFGNKVFRELQREAINSILHDRDTFVSLPTGGGKSLCFQIPAIVDPVGITFVISPLLALMQDQVHKLKSLGVPAVSINSSSSAKDNRKVLTELSSVDNCSIKLVYITPERLAQPDFIELLKNIDSRGKLKRLIVDEAHCISEWGHSFRPKYRLISKFRQQFPHIPIAAFTATATPTVEQDIKESLQLVNPVTISSSFKRDNLLYQVRAKSNDEMQVLRDIYNFINYKYPQSSGIIYCATTRECEAISQYLSECGLSTNYYHASIKSSIRIQLQKDWTAGNFKIVVTTVAFGMGIDKSDTRFVIHHTLPQSIESYYQQTGRAGRDGKHSDCLLYYNKSDLLRIKRIISLSDQNTENLRYQDQFEHHYSDEAQKSIQSTIQKIEMLDSMALFSSNCLSCRRVTLLEYFGEKSNPCLTMCDVCISNNNLSSSSSKSDKLKAKQEISERIYTRNSYSPTSFKKKKNKSNISFDDEID